MESSFFEYRDETGVESDSEADVIDNSLVIEGSFDTKKTPGKNKTVYVAESESCTDDESDEEVNSTPVTKPVLRRSALAAAHLVLSSDDDTIQRRNTRRHPDMSSNKIVSSSSDEDEASPEILPKRRPQKQPSPDTSIIGRKKNKRMILLDSDTENSIIIEHEKHKKLTCLKDTPLKIEVGDAGKLRASVDDSMDHSDNESDMSNDEVESNDEKSDRNNRTGQNDSEMMTNDSDADESKDEINSNDKSGQNDNEDESKDEINSNDKSGQNDNEDEYNDEINENDETGHNDSKKVINESVSNDDNNSQSEDDGSDVSVTDDEGPDEDQMVMSRATRMSIMGVIPKENDSDDSDYIQSDEESRSNSAQDNVSDLPEIQTTHTPKKPETNIDDSRISCSPIASPLHDVTNTIMENSRNSNSFKDPQTSIKSSNASKRDKDDDVEITHVENLDTNRNDAEVTFVGVINTDKTNAKNTKVILKEKVIDDDLTIIDTKPEVIALSSDDEEEKPRKSPKQRVKQEPEAGPSRDASRDVSRDVTIRPYLVPASHPNQVVYVRKEVREMELRKLEQLREDLHNVKHILETMDVESLPDGGLRLISRLSALSHQVQQQGDRVANMVVQPDVPPPQPERADPSWDELQRGSQAVQPRMFGKQAMSTHIAERTLILDSLRDLHASFASRPPESAVASQPRALRTELMPHQRHALTWLTWRETQRPRGGILADDMGLGKTITMIALILSDEEDNIDDDDDDDSGLATSAKGGTLVVCPASLMQQWAAEIEKHCRPHAASVCLHHGAARATHAHRLAASDVVITTYNILQRDKEKNGVLMKVSWRRIILDEAHIVRNHKAATSAAVSALRGVRRWCLTGTPVQNKDLDLFALLKFLRCTPFDDLTMYKKWIDNKSTGGQERLSMLMRCLLLRRTKEQLQQRGQLTCLPTRTLHLLEVTLATQEMNVYQQVLVLSKTLFAQFLHQRAEKNADYSVPADKSEAYHQMHRKMVQLQGVKPVKSHEILVLLLRLRQVCCHCGLIAGMVAEDGAQEDAGRDLLDELNKLSLDDKSLKNEITDEDKENVPEEGTTVAEAIRSVLSLHNPVFKLDRPSSKIEAVMKCLRENVFANKGEKAVVVSQWTSLLSLVQAQLSRERIKCVTLSGEVPVPARAKLVRELNDPGSGVQVMLLSLCAGGVGLNLCGANHLLVLDPHWNPQLEQQAQDRVYRVGQHKPVHIYRFMCVDTVEQSIRKLQQAKLELAENVLTGARNTNVAKLTIQDLKELFNMGSA